MDIISQWANVCESLDEEKRINKALAEGCKEEINEENEEDFDKMSDDDVVKSIKDRTGGDPSYEDILILAKKNNTPEEDIVSQEDYENYSDEDKRRIHTAVIMLDKVQSPKSDEYSKEARRLMTSDPKEFLRRSDELAKDLERWTNTDDVNSKELKMFTYVFSAEVVYHPSNAMEKTPDSDVADQNELKYGDGDTEENSATVFYSKIVPGKYEIAKQDTKEFTDLDEAKSYVAQRVREINERFHITEDEWDTISIKHEQKTGKSSNLVSGLPAEILREDPDAIGFCFSSARDKDGNKVSNDTVGVSETLLFEYFIYRSSKGRIMGSNGIKEIAKTMAEEELS